uniref:Uncharacterized protein n=1 Tax=Triticum urartu TaxID=4572 RepID=A0A8R7R5W2_TRIUA
MLIVGERRLHHHHSASELARQKCPSEGQALQHRCLKHYQVRSYHSASPPSLCRRPLRDHFSMPSSASSRSMGLVTSSPCSHHGHLHHVHDSSSIHAWCSLHRPARRRRVLL